ncbi:MAG TPA: LysR family transcriptional regulator [Novosphingobium sp.]|nr:LysR family transcriptional regulator [Novosphingobium sp.]HZV11264.1 LysR family transcriptional regulator [Novosphingobium sp.]
MDLRQLRYFVMVANERNFTRAAERLHMAQPPLSRQIHQLEEELGQPLFDRAARPLRLTAMGHLFYEQACQVLDRVEQMRGMMTRAAGLEKRRFVIGFVASTIYARLPVLIRRFRALAPHVELVLVDLGSLEQIGALKEGRIDVGFGRIRFEDPAVRRAILREERLVAAVPATHPLAEATAPVPLARIAAEPQILYPNAHRPSYADQVLSLFHDSGLQPRVAHEVRELQIAVGMVAAEEGVCLVPESVQQARSEDVRYIEVAEPLTSPIIMSYRQGDTSRELAIMAAVVAKSYAEWGHKVAAAVQELAAGAAA